MTDQQKLDLIISAVKYQADDETLWFVGQITVGEAYVQQSLRWLHRVIEDQDPQAYANIENQNLGDI